MIEADARPSFLEIDLSSEQGRGLVRTVAERYGPALVRAARLAQRLFLLRSPWAPGLRFVGGETRSDLAGRTSQTSFSLSGTGETLEEAFASCIGEGVDRLAQIECPGDVSLVASLTDVRERVLPSAIPLIDRELDRQGRSRETRLAWVEGEAVGGRDGLDPAGNVLVPADWCLRRPADQVRLAPRTVLSVGVAAGPDDDWAASRALLELVERHAASLWWVGGRRARPVALDAAGMPEIARLLSALRQETRARSTWLLDITTDIAVPTIAALSCSTDGRGLACGLAARLSVAEAARAAILELCQMELAVLLAEVKRADRGEDSLSPVDRAHLDRAGMLDADRCALLHPAGRPAPHRLPGEPSGLSAVQDLLARGGIEAALVRLTRPELGISVVRAIAPVLQPMPSDIVTDRLKRALEETGGGVRHTEGVPLM